MPKYKSRIDEVLTEENVRKLYDASKNKTEQFLISMLWKTGARPSEILELRKENVEIFEDSIKITIVTKKLQADGTSFVLPKRQLELERGTGLHSDIYTETIVQYIQLIPPGSRLLEYTTRWSELVTNRVGMEALQKEICPYHFRHSAVTREASQGRTIDQLKHFKGAKSYRSVEPYLHASPYTISSSK